MTRQRAIKIACGVVVAIVAVGALLPRTVMHTSPESLTAIRQLRIEKKFVEQDMYPGAPDEEIRLRCESIVNRFLDEFVALLARNASKEELLSCAKAMLDSFAEEDTEEREQADTYVGEVMRAVGIEDWTDFI